MNKYIWNRTNKLTDKPNRDVKTKSERETKP
jgi:hypothetical protein